MSEKVMGVVVCGFIAFVLLGIVVGAVVMLITFGILVVPLVFIALDFWTGIRKAKQRGEEITSDGWQRTVQCQEIRFLLGCLACIPICTNSHM